MEIKIRKTFELSEYEQYGILSLFNVIFDKYRTIEYFRNQFNNTALGFSYHSILYDDNRIVGCISFIPSYYMIKDKRYIFALGVDLMISKEYQGQGFFYDIYTDCIEYMRKDGIQFIILFPNEAAYPLYKKSKLTNDIGILTTYVLPYRIGGIKHSLNAFNWLSIFSMLSFVFLTSLFANKKIHNFIIEKDSETYNKKRYTQPNEKYNIVKSEEGGFVYKIMDFNNIRTACLIDVFLKSEKNFNNAIKHIIKHHHKEIDIILYVGHLPFKFHGLIKVPQYFSPKIFYFMGKILKTDDIDKKLFFNLVNWDINLSNYDLL